MTTFELSTKDIGSALNLLKATVTKTRVNTENPIYGSVAVSIFDGALYATTSSEGLSATIPLEDKVDGKHEDTIIIPQELVDALMNKNPDTVTGVTLTSENDMLTIEYSDGTIITNPVHDGYSFDPAIVIRKALHPEDAPLAVDESGNTVPDGNVFLMRGSTLKKLKSNMALFDNDLTDGIEMTGDHRAGLLAFRAERDGQQWYAYTTPDSLIADTAGNDFIGEELPELQSQSSESKVKIAVSAKELKKLLTILSASLDNAKRENTPFDRAIELFESTSIFDEEDGETSAVSGLAQSVAITSLHTVPGIASTRGARISVPAEVIPSIIAALNNVISRNKKKKGQDEPELDSDVIELVDNGTVVTLSDETQDITFQYTTPENPQSALLETSLRVFEDSMTDEITEDGFSIVLGKDALDALTKVPVKDGEVAMQMCGRPDGHVALRAGGHWAGNIISNDQIQQPVDE